MVVDWRRDVGKGLARSWSDDEDAADDENNHDTLTQCFANSNTKGLLRQTQFVLRNMLYNAN